MINKYYQYMTQKIITKSRHLVHIISLTLLVTILGTQILPKTANALYVVVAGETSPTAIMRTVDTTLQRVKSYVLDTLAYNIASIMLQQVTSSVVNWINTGFQGSPSFLSNPRAFFTDVGDQITGAFIANTGVLSGLCSPFNIDIRLALVLGQAEPYPRYTCTLSSVIQNVGNSTINGRSINGFMNGDFKQGGWPAFISMTTETGNNPVGAYLTAQSDLLQRIGVTQNRYSNDLIQGSGFLSWQKCTDISADSVSAQRSLDQEVMGTDYSALNKSGNQRVVTGKDIYSGGTLTTKKAVDKKTGMVTYKNCETQTPGSVIGGSINKSLGIPQDRLNLASSFNQIVNALFAQLVSQVLSGGLKGASSPGKGNLGGVAYQLSQQSVRDQLADSRTTLTDSINGYYTTASRYAQLRQQAMDSISVVKNKYLIARSNFNDKVGSTTQLSLSMPQIIFARNQMAAIDMAIAIKIVPLENTYQIKLVDAKNRLGTIRKLLDETNNATTIEAMKKALKTYSTAISHMTTIDSAQRIPKILSATLPTIATSTLANEIDIMNAQNDLETLQGLPPDQPGQLTPLDKEATEYLQRSEMFPNSIL